MASQAVLQQYNKATPKIGVMNTKHDSEAEAKASFQLFKSGWIPYTSSFPQSFVDADGTVFYAKPDFIHEATGFYAEFKAHKLNGKGSKNAADAAMDEVASQIALGFTRPTDIGFKRLQHAWNHSIQKVATCSSQLPNNTPLVLIYESAPDLNEERRCKRNGILMLHLANMNTFNFYLRMASFGLDVGFKRNGFSYGVQPSI